MKNLKYLIALFGLISILMAGCSNSGVSVVNEVQSIEVQKRVGNEYKYEDFKDIRNTEQIQKVKLILDNTNWRNAKVDMIRFPDYRFDFQFNDPEIETKSVVYELWVSPNKDKLELIIDAESKYIQLDKIKSAELFEILTGNKLSEVNL